MELENKRSEVQEIIWDIMKEIKFFLDEEHIEYHMLGGTLLGAIRHRGFIPWDDDIDIGIPRNQYEKFLKKIVTLLPEYMELQTFSNNSSHHYYFSRIVDSRHALKRMGSEVVRNENVWVDIFPLDGMPNHWFLRKIQMVKLLAIRTMYHISCFEKVNLKRPNRPMSERIVISFVQLTGFGRKSDMYAWLHRLDSTLKKYPYETSEWVVNFMGQYKFKEMFPKSYYGKGKFYDFEDDKLMGPVNADAVLTQMYGDYMKPPKEADKNAHAAEMVK